MKCPYCNKEHKSKHHMTADRNCDNYGDDTFHFQCSHCKKVYSVAYQRIVRHQKPYQSIVDVDDVSFGLG